MATSRCLIVRSHPPAGPSSPPATPPSLPDPLPRRLPYPLLSPPGPPLALSPSSHPSANPLTCGGLVEVGRVGVSCSVADFGSAVDVWIQRPQVVNRRLLGAVVSEWGAGHEGHCQRKLLPRQQGIPHGQEDIQVSEGGDVFLFTSYQQGTDAAGQDGRCGDQHIVYQLSYVRDSATDHSVRLAVPVHLSGDHTPPLAGEQEPVASRCTVPSVSWLVGVLLPRIAQWAGEGGAGMTQGSPAHHCLVPLERFAATYSRMKEQYGRHLVQDWPESTDPHKFVYEDISIAAYLLVLWEVEREELGEPQKKQSFVDLGCGNGLLVYLLASEGHPGKGIDLQRRKVWQRFQPPAILEEQSIVPSDAHLFPDCDWLLGNHSDELTPWIPMMAARSSYRTKFFVLPCCPHDFVGRYARTSCHVSQYRSYLDYVALIGRWAGFIVRRDTLRIPSSKRVCLIGQQRGYLATEEEKAEAARCAFLKERMCSPGKPPSLTHLSTSSDAVPSGGSEWCKAFRPRPKSSSLSRNCSQVDPLLRDHIIATVAEVLLQAPLRQDGEMRVMQRGGPWLRGGSLPLEEVVGLFDRATLEQLRNECGGVQTLLRNQHQVFEVESGVVRVRDWSTMKDQVQQAKRSKSRPKRGQLAFHKTKLCWFAQHHPQGCPRGNGTCTYAHCQEELRDRPNFDSENVCRCND